MILKRSMELATTFVTSVVGSFPRPDYLLTAEKMHGLNSPEFGGAVDKARKDVISEQENAGVDVITDGEQQRSSFVSVVGQRIKGFRLMDIRELDPDALAILSDTKTQLTYSRAVVTDDLGVEDLAVGDFEKAKQFTIRPIKVTLPAPYLVMWETWHNELSRTAYPCPENLAWEYAHFLNAEIRKLVSAGAAFVQLDEPMLGDLTEAGPEPDRYHAVLTRLYGQKYRGFEEEKKLAVDLVNEAVKGAQGGPVRIGMHMDRWPNTDSPYFNQGYERLFPELFEVRVDQLVLEYTSKGCGDPLEVIGDARFDYELGFGCVSVRDRRVETPEEIVKRVEPVAKELDPKRIWLNPDCGFAPGMYRGFPRETAFAKLRSMVKAAQTLREKYA